MIALRRCVLGVDQATSSGWCIHIGQMPIRWGLACNAFERRDVLNLAVFFAREQGQNSFVFVYEAHAEMRRVAGSRASVMMLGGQLHRWLEQLDLMLHPHALRLGVPPDTWQRVVLGCSAKAPRHERKARSLMWASQHVRQAITSDDVSDAVALSRFGTLDGVRLLEQQQDKVIRARRKEKKARSRMI